MNIIIIEDEPRTAKDLKAILEGLDGEIIVLDILLSVSAAIKWFREHTAPDLVFSDIQLGDGLSFEIFQEVQTSAPVVFCTAYDQYAIAAFESNGIDYLLKPIEEQMVERSINKFKRVKAHISGDTYTGNLKRAMDQLNTNYKQSILVHFREKIIPVKVMDICYVYATSGTVILHTTDDRDYVIQYTIDQLETILNPQIFFRANRQFVINRNSVDSIEHYFNRRLITKIKCKTPEKVIISRLKVQDFLNWIEL